MALCTFILPCAGRRKRRMRPWISNLEEALRQPFTFEDERILRRKGEVASDPSQLGRNIQRVGSLPSDRQMQDARGAFRGGLNSFVPWHPRAFDVRGSTARDIAT